ncbi:MAG TPA: transposase [Ktedonobacterales bacterium]|jgi:quinol monooxygenase YgiN
MESFILTQREFSMVIRVIRAHAQQGKRPDYIDICTNTTIPRMRQQPGYLDYRICAAHPKQPDRVVFATLWDNDAAVESFFRTHAAGMNWRTATTLPWEAQTNFLVSADVTYIYDDYRSLIAMAAHVAGYVQRRAAATPPPLVTNAQWQIVAPILASSLASPSGRGRPRKDDRPIFDGVLSVILTGSFWSNVPPPTNTTTAWRRYAEWELAGVWDQAWLALLQTLPAQMRQMWALDFLDCSHPPPRRH